MRLVRILSEFRASPSLSKQVPAAVELDLHVLQAPLIFVELLCVVAVRLLAAAKLLLFGDQVLDPIGDALIVHEPILARRRIRSVVPRSEALIDEIANELATWPGVHIERRADGAAQVRYGPADVTSVIELFDRRYRDVRGEDDPYSSEDAG